MALITKNTKIKSVNINKEFYTYNEFYDYLNKLIYYKRLNILFNDLKININRTRSKFDGDINIQQCKFYKITPSLDEYEYTDIYEYGKSLLDTNINDIDQAFDEITYLYNINNKYAHLSIFYCLFTGVNEDYDLIYIINYKDQSIEVYNVYE